MTFKKEVLAEGIELYLGDCREVLPTLGKVETLITDPPYGMQFRSNHRGIKHEAIVNDEEEWPLVLAVDICATYSKYVFCRWDDVSRVNKPKSIVTWVKNNWSMGDLKHEHARQTEIILFYPGTDHFFPGQRPQDVVTSARTGNDFHPTEKPVQLMQNIIGWTSGIVLDPFMGSGTTGVACVSLNRKFIGI